MELQLDLSLSTHQFSNGFDSKQITSFKPWRNLDDEDECLVDKKKRRFENAFENNTTKFKEGVSLPLLLWSGQPNDQDDDDDHRIKKKLSCPLNEVAEEEEDHQVVGWPPIKTWRKKLLHHQQQGGRIIIKNRVAAAATTAVQEHTNMNGGGGSSYKYVKVKMEGIAIARKIDLRLFQSYQTLTNFLINMFPKCEKDDESTNYILAYQHKDGDWLLAGDVPWQTFMESVQCLKLLRHGG